jgi:hypothetical protein
VGDLRNLKNSLQHTYVVEARPRFKVGQQVEVSIDGKLYLVAINNRICEFDIDKTSVPASFKYDIGHISIRSLSWNKVSEKSLCFMIAGAKRQRGK